MTRTRRRGRAGPYHRNFAASTLTGLAAAASRADKAWRKRRAVANGRGIRAAQDDAELRDAFVRSVIDAELDAYRTRIEIGAQGTLNFAYFAARAPIVLNGGALVAILAFMANRAPSHPVPPHFFYPLLVFVAGAVGGAIGYFILYLGQFRYEQQLDRQGDRLVCWGFILIGLGILTFLGGAVWFGYSQTLQTSRL